MLEKVQSGDTRRPQSISLQVSDVEIDSPRLSLEITEPDDAGDLRD